MISEIFHILKLIVIQKVFIKPKKTTFEPCQCLDFMSSVLKSLITLTYKDDYNRKIIGCGCYNSHKQRHPQTSSCILCAKFSIKYRFFY